jgi:hypothetical protein
MRMGQTLFAVDGVVILAAERIAVSKPFLKLLCENSYQYSAILSSSEIGARRDDDKDPEGEKLLTEVAATGRPHLLPRLPDRRAEGQTLWRAEVVSIPSGGCGGGALPPIPRLLRIAGQSVRPR